jgi:CheY-like chemotaxis protein
MLTNLIFNAVDAMPSGGTLTVTTRQEANEVVIEMADTGVGMTDAVRLRSLEPFFTTKGEEGTGLGLAVVHGVVQRHNGTVDIRSEAGRGSTFIMKFPVADGQNTEIEGDIPVDKRVARRRILLVDDGEAPLRITEEMLREVGHDVVAVMSGIEALARFPTGEFDVVITDRAMPGMNGDDVAAAVKKADPDMPVIMLTGFGAMMEFSGEQPESVDLIVSKPFTMDELVEALSKVGAAHA